MSIMSCRFDGLLNTIEGYAKTGLQLIEYNGNKFFPAGLSDDIGTYLFVPKLVRFFNISLEQAISFFFYGMVVLSCFLGLIGFFLLSKSWLFKIFATCSLILFSCISCRGMTDVYLVQSSIVIAIIPLALYFVKKNKASFLFVIFLFLSGISAGYAHYVRSFSSVAIILFLLIVLLFLFDGSWKKRIVLISTFSLGLVVPIIHFQTVLQQRDAYFGSKNKMFESRHVFWHSLYAGFGFLQNDFSIAWDDTTIIEKIKKRAPQAVYPTRAYERATKTAFFDLVKEHPQFVLQTLFAKFGVIFYYFLLFANFGLLAAFFYRKSWILDCAFLVALSFNSIFGFIALPGRYYLLGMLSCTVLYNLVSIEHALNQGVINDFLLLLKKVSRILRKK
ncbi:hypothetical protein KAH94_01365 [bacterium]|nr:hypothetical protein [bacterium]